MSPGVRHPALDQLRAFLVVLVVLNHSVLAYCTFGHVDRIDYALSTAPIVDGARWIGFDVVVKLNDGFFMPLLFLLSGLFVWDSLLRKGAARFLRGRLVRLAAPFAVAELTVVPLAYYPSYLQAGGASGFAAFWFTTITDGPWPSGPPWFIAVLFLFDVAAALIFRATGRSAAVPVRPRRPGSCFPLLLIASALLYLPLLAVFGPYRWIALGPVAVQGSRILLYAAYFAAGVMLGRLGPPALLRFGEALARQCWVWAGIAALAAAGVLASSPRPALTGLALVIFCAAACFALPALFLRFGGGPGPVWAGLASNSFAIYLVHYPMVTWTQFALLSLPLVAIGKGLLTFVIALALAWLSSLLLRAIAFASLN